MFLRCLCLSLLLSTAAAAPVRTGLDALAERGFSDLAGRRLGLVVNHSAVNREGRPLLELLAQAPEVRLVRIFSPEHGLFGLADHKVASGTYEPLGVPVFSLYGEHVAPTPESLADLDTLLFDMQDIGARFYTYITTLARVMEVAASTGTEVWVLDRPNPIGGRVVAGPVMEASLLRPFRGPFPLPIQHGMTVGELARLFNEHFEIGCRLRVVGMEGWRRGMLFDETGLPWINPSPNMRSLSGALLYPGLGILETGNLSVGRGTPTPFEVYGAPWLEHERLCAAVNARRPPGARLVPVEFTPTAYKFAGQPCRGFRVVLTHPHRLEAVQLYLLIAGELFRLHPEVYDPGHAVGHIGSDGVLVGLRAGRSPAAIQADWQEELDRFRKTRARFLLYP